MVTRNGVPGYGSAGTGAPKGGPPRSSTPRAAGSAASYTARRSSLYLAVNDRRRGRSERGLIAPSSTDVPGRSAAVRVNVIKPLLAEEPRGPGLQRLIELGVVVEGRQDKDTGRRGAGDDLTGGRDAVQVKRPDVHENDARKPPTVPQPRIGAARRCRTRSSRNGRRGLSESRGEQVPTVLSQAHPHQPVLISNPTAWRAGIVQESPRRLRGAFLAAGTPRR